METEKLHKNINCKTVKSSTLFLGDEAVVLKSEYVLWNVVEFFVNSTDTSS